VPPLGVELVGVKTHAPCVLAIVCGIESPRPDPLLADSQRPQRGDMKERLGKVEARGADSVVVELYGVGVAGRDGRKAVDLLFAGRRQGGKPTPIGRVEQ